MPFDYGVICSEVKILLDLYLKYKIGSLTVFTPLNRSNGAFLNENDTR